ncbi:MAG: HEAT repeat domain-containing protein, partial [bacterium]|nr:HEAT repeat domain-containing protein [bacterium]
DAAGRRIHFEWAYPVSSLPAGAKYAVQEMAYITARPGEKKSCNGCHAPDEESPGQPDPTYSLALSQAPVRLDRDTTDILFRRNEPDEYRTQARIGEADRYAPWLSSPDPELRRRACELLAADEDGGRPHSSTIATLLADESSQVRRAAATALGRLGGPEWAPALVKSLADLDWQTRFHAATALEAITGCAPPSKNVSAAEYYQRILADPESTGGLAQAIGKGPGALRTDDSDALARWCEAAGRLGEHAPESAREIVRNALRVPLPPPVAFAPLAGKRRPLVGLPPEIAAIRAAGWMRDAPCVELLIPWLEHYEYQDHITEVALALGRIRTPEAIDALWQALRRDVPNKTPYLTRYLQRGPRPEEYAILRGLILAGANVVIDDVHLIIALAPGSFLEKPRYEDRLRPETQRVLLGRILLNRAGLRTKAVEILLSVLRDEAKKDAPLYQEILKGINLERPFAEHRRPFPVVESIEPEQALWLLG